MDISPQVLLNAYCQGFFPMAHPEEGNAIYWYDPDPRTIIPLDTYHVPKRLSRTLKQKTFELRYNSNFAAVIRACAEVAPGRSSTWISDAIIELYTELYQLGYAYSVESYREGKLVGGVYGVSIGGFFAGESMFSRVTDASKVALVTLLQHLHKQGFSLFDVQFSNPHLLQFGAKELSRREYKYKLSKALTQKLCFF